MDRLTTRYDGYAVIAWGLEGKYTAEEWIDILTDRLAAYEDTGLEPEEISGLCSMSERAKMADMLMLEEYKASGPVDHLRELAQAEKDGRLAVLPCKEGDPVWWIDVDWLPQNGTMFYKISSGKFRYTMLDWNNPVYTSQAEAEAALKKRGETGP